MNYFIKMLPLKRVLDAVSLVRLTLHISIWYINPGRLFLNYPRLADPVKIENRHILKNPISYSKKLATKMTLSLAPLTITKVDLDKNVW